MSRVVRLYKRDGTYLKDLTALSVSVSVDRQRAVRRTATIELPGSALADVKVLGRQVRVYDGATQLFGGYIDDPQARVEPEGTIVTVSCRDRSKLLKLSRFVVDTTYEDLDARETPNLVTTATASSSLAVGGEIQGYAVVYQRSLQATVLGVTKAVTGVETGDVLKGTYQVDYAEEGLTQLALEVRVDLRVEESVQAVTATTNGTLGTMQVSTDGTTWANYAPGTFRYLKVPVTRACGPITLGLVITAGAAYPTTNVLTDNGTSWRPAPSDVDRYIDLELVTSQAVTDEIVGTGDGSNKVFVLDWSPVVAGSDTVRVDGTVKTRGTDYTIDNATGTITFVAAPAAGAVVTASYTYTPKVNVLYLRWGVNSRDRTTRFVYSLKGSNDKASWTTLAAEAAATSSRRVEHLIDTASYRYIRVQVLRASGPVALRYAEARNVVAATSIHLLIKSLAESEGETRFALTATRQYVRTITFEAGTEKWAAMQELAGLLGWELYYSADETLTLRPSDDIDVTDPDIPTYRAMFDLAATWSDAELYNEVIGLYQAADTTLRSEQRDDNAFSATGIPRIGRRTTVRQNPLADTQAKLDAWTLDLLGRLSRQTTTVAFSVSGVPTHEAGDLVRLVEEQTGISGLFTLESFSVEDSGGGEYLLRAQVTEEVV